MSKMFSVVTLDAPHSLMTEHFVPGSPDGLDELLDCDEISEVLAEWPLGDTIEAKIQTYLYGDGETVRADKEDLAFFREHFDELDASDSLDCISDHSFSFESDELDFGYGEESEVDKLLLPIIMICVCALLGGGTLIFLKLSAKHKKSKNKDKEELAQITANEFVNVKDIRGNFLYTRDNLALAYLKIYPISTELFSKNEKRLIAKQLTVSLSSAQYPFQLLAVSRPVDISPLLSELSATLTSSSDVKQKELLKQEIVEMGAFALSGEVVERQFYIKIWDRVSDGVERDLLQKLKLLGGYFSDSGIQTEILQQQDIVRLCNLVNNPAYVHLEDSGINAAIPILESVGVV